MQVNEDSVKSELVHTKDKDAHPSHTYSSAAAIQSKRTTKRLKHLQSDSNQPANANDSDTLFGQFVAAELHAIIDPAKKLYTKLLIHNIINTAISEH